MLQPTVLDAPENKDRWIDDTKQQFVRSYTNRYKSQIHRHQENSINKTTLPSNKDNFWTRCLLTPQPTVFVAAENKMYMVDKKLVRRGTHQYKNWLRHRRYYFNRKNRVLTCGRCLFGHQSCLTLQPTVHDNAENKDWRDEKEVG